jgi:hypothetical protein
MQSVVILPIPIPVIVPALEASGGGWLKRPKQPWPLKPSPGKWPLKQSIPTPAPHPDLSQARKMLEEQRAQRAAP